MGGPEGGKRGQVCLALPPRLLSYSCSIIAAAPEIVV